jgi:uncharacterized small protein (DUF1192 family)
LPGKNGRYSKNGSGNGRNGQSETIAVAITEVSERLTRLVHDEIELAKAEMTQKATSLARGAAAVAAGAVFGVFAVVFFLLTVAWVIDGIFVEGVGSIWLGFLVVLLVLLALTVFAFLFAYRKLSVGAPVPTMAIDEAKKIRETMAAGTTEPNPAAASNGQPAAAADGQPGAQPAVSAVSAPAQQPGTPPTPPAGTSPTPPAGTSPTPPAGTSPTPPAGPPPTPGGTG